MDTELTFVPPKRIPSPRKAPVIDPASVAESWEPPEPFYTLTFDPGGTSGWALFGIWPEAMHDSEQRILDNVAFWSAGQFTGPEEQQVDQMMSLIEVWPEETRLLSEDFILQQFSMSRDLLAPVRINARLADRIYVKYGYRRTLNHQMASMAMRSVTDDRLKVWGFWAPLSGQQHARDAVKHNITWLRRLKTQIIADIASENKE